MTNSIDLKYISIARPYALAVFEYAKEKRQLAEWQAFLTSAALVASDPQLLKLTAHHAITETQLLSVFKDVLSSLLTPDNTNFLHLLSQNNRFLALPAIAAEFDSAYAELEKQSSVRMISAVPIKEELRRKFAHSLSLRLQHEVTLHCEVNKSLVGGAIIHIGDKVIDGSVRGTLARLLQNIAT